MSPLDPRRGPPLSPSASLDEIYKAAIGLHQAGRSAEAATLYDRILRQQPRHHGALHLKGVLALQANRYDDAIELIEQSLELFPRHAMALSNLAVALRGKNRMLEAIAALEKSLALDPKSADAWTNLAQTQMRAGLTSDAVASARHAIALAPDRLGARSFMLFGANNLAEIDPVELAEDARAFGAVAQRLAPPRTSHPNDPDPHRRLKVGLVSGDLRSHPVGRFLIAVLGAIDPSALELHAYSDTREVDGLTEKLREVIPVWRDTRKLSDAGLAKVIADDGIDILVDLAGHSRGNRLLTFASKPAPVSFTWIGYFATTGLTSIDYVLANRWVIPPDEEAQWTEKVWRLPESYLCFSVPPDAPDVGPLPALATGQVTFGSFNNFNKLSDRALSAWSALLDRVQGSRLILRSSGADYEGLVDELRRRLARLGVPLDRVRIDPKITSYAAHLESYREIDVALDPFPYNGGTTTVEALFMGVPVLVRRGDRYVAHMGESILHNSGLADWIAPDEASYPTLGASFAADLPALGALRENLRNRMLASPLFDAGRFARQFEDALRQMWTAWCADQRS